jgi:hypothetical protein
MLKPVKEALQANIAARRRLTPEPANKIKQLTAAEAAEALNGWVYKQPGMPTKADCIKVLDQMMLKFGYAECKVLLQRYAVECINDLWIGLYQNLVDFGNATLEYNYPPSGSWTTDNIPTHLSRWLVSHAESDSLFEVFDYAELLQCLENQADDVTGIDKFETMFKLKLSEGEL